MSSLIEEAAKRLQELRAAGVASDPLSPPRVGSDTVVRSATEVAAVLPLDAKRALHPATGAGASGDRPSSAHAESGDRRYVEIDFARLRAQGFVTPDAGASQIAEEFRVIKRPIIRNAVGKAAEHIKHGNLVMVTSALPSEGKTFTAINLALSIATEIDSTVLLVDGDVAHPSIPGLLNAPHGPGLLDLLTSDSLDFADALVKTNIDKLSILP